MANPKMIIQIDEITFKPIVAYKIFWRFYIKYNLNNKQISLSFLKK
jgi:hypothetical protein